VSDVPMNIASALDNGSITDAEALTRMGYNLDGIHWMICDDEIPVFWKNEVAPYLSL
jgi:hypothetical protein